MHAITPLTPDAYADSVKGLAELLADAVDGGSSLGFLAPFDPDEAAVWWHTQAGAVAGGSLLVWAAHDADGVNGTVSLRLSPMPNGRHRAEILKLMVHRRARGQGLARALLGVAEKAAGAAGVGLLVLDTESGSAAEALYLSEGWTRFGVVPGYAADADGTLTDCSFFYKQLATPVRDGPTPVRDGPASGCH